MKVYESSISSLCVNARLTTTDLIQYPGAWSPDGRLLAFVEGHPVSGSDIWILPVEGDRRPRPFVRTPFNEDSPAFSPDGRSMAYRSDESGHSEIYVRPFPGPGERVQVSTAGGVEPVWSRDGHELFYRSGNRMTIVPISAGSRAAAGPPRVLFERNYFMFGAGLQFPEYDVTPDGQRFVMMTAPKQENIDNRFNIVLNWRTDVERALALPR
jgi:dipeptidyl aminopeptidase/acylaminoacyl peptidase